MKSVRFFNKISVSILDKNHPAAANLNSQEKHHYIKQKFSIVLSLRCPIDGYSSGTTSANVQTNSQPTLQDKLLARVAELLDKAGVQVQGSGSLALDFDENGNIEIIGDISNKDEVAAALNGDDEILSILQQGASSDSSNENNSGWPSQAYVVDLSDERRVYDFSKIAYSNRNAATDRLYSQMEVMKLGAPSLLKDSNPLVNERGWKLSGDGQSAIDSFFGNTSCFSSMQEREYLLDYVASKLDAAGIDPAVNGFYADAADSINTSLSFSGGKLVDDRTEQVAEKSISDAKGAIKEVVRSFNNYSASDDYVRLDGGDTKIQSFDVIIDENGNATFASGESSNGEKLMENAKDSAINAALAGIKPDVITKLLDQYNSEHGDTDEDSPSIKVVYKNGRIDIEVINTTVANFSANATDSANKNIMSRQSDSQTRPLQTDYYSNSLRLR